MDGPIRHVDSVQHQSLFVSNSSQMPQVLSFHPQSLLPPSPIQPTIGATGILWKQSGVTVTNSNLMTNYYHRSNNQLRPNRFFDVNTNISIFVNTLLNDLFLAGTWKKIIKKLKKSNRRCM